MTITYSLAGVPLDDAAGRWKLLKGTTVGAGLTVRSVDQQIPGVDGTISGVGETLDAPTFIAKMEIRGSSYADMRRNWSALLPILGSTVDVPLVQSVDGVDWSITARGKSVTQPDFSAYRKTVTATATLRLPGVYWRASSADWSKANPTSGTAYAVSTLANSSAPVDDALVLLTGPASSPKVACGSSWVQLNLTLASGEKALIDCAKWVVRRGSGVTFDGGGTVASGSIVSSPGPYRGYLLRLVPQMVGIDPTVTATKVTLTASGLTSASAIAVRAKPAFLV